MEETGKRADPTLAVASVLGNEDLLREIILRLSSPTTLVRAAAVSKRWLRHASDPALLSRFRHLHPPRPIGFYVGAISLIDGDLPIRFVPFPQPPELTSAVRRCSSHLGHNATYIFDCRHGRLLASVKDFTEAYIMCSPKHPDRGPTALPSPPWPAEDGDTICLSRDMLLPMDGIDGLSCTMVVLMCNDQGMWTHVCELHDGAWGQGRNSDFIDLPEVSSTYNIHSLIAYGKAYVSCMAGHILGVDLQSMSSFCIKLPEEVQYGRPNFGLSHAEGPGFCLVHVKGFQLCVWLHTVDSSSGGNWKILDTICLRQVFGHHIDLTCLSAGSVFMVLTVGENADYVFLKIQHKVFYMNILNRTVEKVYRPTSDFELIYMVCPSIMPWPPTFSLG